MIAHDDKQRVHTIKLASSNVHASRYCVYVHSKLDTIFFFFSLIVYGRRSISCRTLFVSKLQHVRETVVLPCGKKARGDVLRVRKLKLSSFGFLEYLTTTGVKDCALLITTFLLPTSSCTHTVLYATSLRAVEAQPRTKKLKLSQNFFFSSFFVP